MNKLLLYLATISGLILLTSGSGFAQCSMYFTYGDTTICPGDSTWITANAPAASQNITTTYAAGNNHRGNMFDIVAINEITIESVDAHPMTNTDIAVYYKVGGFAGFENNAGAWTLVGTASVVAQPQGSPTPVPVPINVTIPAGQTYGFYVTSTNVSVSLNYTDGTAQGAVYVQDANLQVLQGVGLEYPFSGTPFTPRMWNGTIHYSTGAATTYNWSNGATTPTIEIAPGASTWYTVDVDISGCPTITDSLEIVVYPLPSGLGPDTTICVNHSLILDAGSGNYSYQWSTSETTQSITVDGATQGVGTANYSVVVTNALSCTMIDTIAVTVDQCAGIDENALTKVKVYPNPATSALTIETANANAALIEIHDLTGALVKQVRLTQFKTLINVSEFNNGMYFYKVKSNDDRLIDSGKIIVKK